MTPGYLKRGREILVESVVSAGYRLRVVQTFTEACADITAAAPDLLVAQVRLGASMVAS